MKTVLLLDTENQRVKIMISFLKKYDLELIHCRNEMQFKNLLANYPVELIITIIDKDKLSNIK